MQAKMTARYRSPLGRMIPESMDTEEIKRRGYREDGIVVIDLNNDRLDVIEREIVKRWADQRYGQSKGKGR